MVSESIDQFLSEQQIRKIKICNSVVDKFINSPYTDTQLMDRLKLSRLPKYFKNEKASCVCPSDTVLSDVLLLPNLINRVRCFKRCDLLAGKNLPELIERERKAVECLAEDFAGPSSNHSKKARPQGKYAYENLGFHTDIKQLIALRILQEYPDVTDEVGEALANNYLNEFEASMFQKNYIRLYNELVEMNNFCKY